MIWTNPDVTIHSIKTVILFFFLRYIFKILFLLTALFFDTVSKDSTQPSFFIAWSEKIVTCVSKGERSQVAFILTVDPFWS